MKIFRYRNVGILIAAYVVLYFVHGALGRRTYAEASYSAFQLVELLSALCLFAIPIVFIGASIAHLVRLRKK